MAKQVWKYSLPELGRCVLDMPTGAEILTLQMQYGKPCIWALCESSAPPEKRYFVVAGTGWPLSNPIKAYVGTFFMEGTSLVWHVFEVTE